MRSSSHQGPSWAAGLVVALAAFEARAQTAPALPPTPPAASWPTPAPWPAPSQPAPLQPAYDDERAAQRALMVVEAPTLRRCADEERGGRVMAEGLSVIGTTTGIVLLTAFLVRSERESGTQALTALGGVAAYLFVVPAVQHAVARNFGGNGAWWASLLGGLLLPVIGHVIGYELSHEPRCDDPQRAAAGPHPRRAPYVGEEAGGALVAPSLAPAPGGGAVGMTVTF